MIVVVNGKELAINNALEVNEAIIPKSKHGEFLLNDGDQIEIIKAVGGG